MRQTMPIHEAFKRWLPDEQRTLALVDLEFRASGLMRQWRRRYLSVLAGLWIMIVIVGMCGALMIRAFGVPDVNSLSVQLMGGGALLVGLAAFEELRRMKVRRSPFIMPLLTMEPPSLAAAFLELCHADGDADWVGMYGEHRQFRASGFLRQTAFALLSSDPENRAIGYPAPPGMVDPELRVRIPDTDVQGKAAIEGEPPQVACEQTDGEDDEAEHTTQSRHRQMSRNNTVYAASRVAFENALSLAYSPHFVMSNHQQLHFGALAIYDVWEREPALRSFKKIMARAYVRMDEIAPQSVPRFPSASDRSFRRLLDEEHAPFRDMRATLGFRKNLID